MAQDNRRITELTYKAVSGEITPEEMTELLVFLDQSPEHRARFEQRIEKGNVQQKVEVFRRWEDAKEKSKEKTLQAIAREKRSTVVFWEPVAVAASVLLLVGGLMLYNFLGSPVHDTAGTALTKTPDLLPGTSRATLTLASGQKIALDSSVRGVVGAQGNMKIAATSGGQLAYQKMSDQAPTLMFYNTLTTEKAAQYSVRLPDGSRAWLNNASSLRYPVSFSGPKREVELTGEAYFEVAKDVVRPFRVVVLPNTPNKNSSTIEVLGTSFNIQNYPGEPMQATLLTGSVKVAVVGRGSQVQLKPGEQVTLVEGLGGENRIEVKSDIDTAGVVAWKNGHFHFDRSDIHAVMRQLARWYDIEEVHYKMPVTTHLFSGDIGRDLTLSQVAEILGHHIHFELDDKKITVMP